MNSGAALTALSLMAAWYHAKMTGNRAALRPRPEQALMVLALVLAFAGFSHPGVAGFILPETHDE